MRYVFGLIETDGAPDPNVIAQLPDVLGPVSACRIGKWTLISGDYAGNEVLPKRRLMLAHTRVLEMLMELGTLLPARFGLLADNQAELEALVQQRSSEITETFDRVRGCVELGIRISYDRQSALQATMTGQRDLISRRDRLANRGPEAHFERAEFGRAIAEHLDRRRGSAQKALINTLSAICKSHVLRAPEEDVEVLRAEFLIEQDRQADFVAAVDRAASECDFAPGAEPKIQVVGPVPVYNFVRLSLDRSRSEEAA